MIPTVENKSIVLGPAIGAGAMLVFIVGAFVVFVLIASSDFVASAFLFSLVAAKGGMTILEKWPRIPQRMFLDLPSIYI